MHALLRAITAKPTLRDRACHTNPVQPAESVRTWTGRRTRRASSPAPWPAAASAGSPAMAASSRATLVGDVVGSGVAGPQLHGEGLPGGIGEAVDGVEPVAALVVGRRLLLVLRVDL